MEFKKIELSDLPFIKSVVNKQPYRICDYTVYNLYVWSNYYHYTYAKVGDGLMLKYIDENEIVYSFPLVFNSSPYKYIDELKTKLNFSMTCLEEVQKLKECYDVKINENRDFFDYLYDINELAYLIGKRNNKLRNHVNKFNSLYSNKAKFSLITSDDKERINQFINDYKDESNDDESYLYDLETCRYIFTNYDLFKDYIISYKLEIDGKLVGIASGEIIQDTFYLHVLKAFREYPGIYHYMNKEICLRVKETNENVMYVNREEDVGDLGLRKSKLQYHPLRLIEKYSVKML